MEEYKNYDREALKEQASKIMINNAENLIHDDKGYIGGFIIDSEGLLNAMEQFAVTYSNQISVKQSAQTLKPKKLINSTIITINVIAIFFYIWIAIFQVAMNPTDNLSLLTMLAGACGVSTWLIIKEI